MKLSYPFRRTCREVAALILAREDRALNPAERLAVRIHFLVCEACPRFERQVLEMRHALHLWRHYCEQDEDVNPG